ncbi:MAG: T9SS type A sorting domain-containing protein, partial [Sediminibacterium sp.]|nr:T9SS type A sorting domain-containing protein [Sediminibacterium sp.]
QTYTVSGTSSAGCVGNVVTSSVTVNALPVLSVNSGSICAGGTFTIVPSGAATYTVQGGNTVVSPSNNQTYTVSGTSSAGCLGNVVTSSVTVNALPVLSVNSGSICAGGTFTIVPSGAATYTVQGGNTVVNPMSTSSYSVIGTTISGCQSASPVISTVVVNQNPVLTISSTHSLICVGQSVSLTVSGAASYLWSTGATSSVIAASPALTTSYSVTGQSVNSCTTQAVITQSVDACLMTAFNAQEAISVKLYPNPSATGYVIVSGLPENAEVYIFNIAGQQMALKKATTEPVVMDVQGFISGMYFVKWRLGESEGVYKLVIAND